MCFIFPVFSKKVCDLKSNVWRVESLGEINSQESFDEHVFFKNVLCDIKRWLFSKIIKKYFFLIISLTRKVNNRYNILKISILRLTTLVLSL